jgi:hypothetical protein
MILNRDSTVIDVRLEHQLPQTMCLTVKPEWNGVPDIDNSISSQLRLRAV